MRDDEAKIPEDAGVDAKDNDDVDDQDNDEVDAGFDLDRGDAASPPAGPRRTSRRGGILGAAMLGFHQAMFGKQETETVVEIESSGDPPNIDLDGLDEDLDAHRRMVGPPLDQIKARRQPSRRTRRRR